MFLNLQIHAAYIFWWSHTNRDSSKLSKLDISYELIVGNIFTLFHSFHSSYYGNISAFFLQRISMKDEEHAFALIIHRAGAAREAFGNFYKTKEHQALCIRTSCEN